MGWIRHHHHIHFDGHIVNPYHYPKHYYFSVRECKHTNATPLESNLEFIGLEFHKELHLFGQSNSAMPGWLYTPFIDQENTQLAPLWRPLVPYIFDTKALAEHCLSMTNKAWLRFLQSDEVSLKRYLYFFNLLLVFR